MPKARTSQRRFPGHARPPDQCWTPTPAALGLRRVGIVGHDVGGALMQTLARKTPERFCGLFFFEFLYPGIGARMAEPERLNNIWYQSFNQLEMAPRLAAQPAQRSVLVLDQSSAGLPFNAAVTSAIRSTINAGSRSPTSFYSEHLDANRFFGPEYENEFIQFLEAKYRERHIES